MIVALGLDCKYFSIPYRIQRKEKKKKLTGEHSWSINQQGYGEIDIVEGANDQVHNCMTLHTLGQCSFFPRNETGITNGNECGLTQGTAGCDTQGGQYGTGFNNGGGGVYATRWNSQAIQVFFWARDDIPDDVSSGNPKPDSWGIPLAQFAGASGGCDIDTNFKSQTIVS